MRVALMDADIAVGSAIDLDDTLRVALCDGIDVDLCVDLSDALDAIDDDEVVDNWRPSRLRRLFDFH